ncbi:A-kinase anchor protein 4 [Bienertia sinuspersici]
MELMGLDMGDNVGDNCGDNGDDTGGESGPKSDYEVNTDEDELMSDGDEVQNEDGERQNEDDFDTSLTPYVHDDYDPYDGLVWDDDCEDMDNYLQRLYRNGEFYQDKDFGKIEIKAWQLFTDELHLREVLRDCYIQSGFAVVVETANNKEYTVRCNDERCYCRLHAAVLPNNIASAIKSIQGSRHTCMGLQTNNTMVTTQWACKALIEYIRAHENITGKVRNGLLSKRYKRYMGATISHSFLPAYFEVLRETNPEFVAIYKWFSENYPNRPLTFSSIFISFKATVDGFLAGCRGVMGVNGTFLKGNYGGVLLSAVALDGNNEMFPIS